MNPATLALVLAALVMPGDDVLRPLPAPRIERWTLLESVQHPAYARVIAYDQQGSYLDEIYLEQRDGRIVVTHIDKEP